MKIIHKEDKNTTAVVLEISCVVRFIYTYAMVVRPERMYMYLPKSGGLLLLEISVFIKFAVLDQNEPCNNTET